MDMGHDLYSASYNLTTSNFELEASDPGQRFCAESALVRDAPVVFVVGGLCLCPAAVSLASLLDKL